MITYGILMVALAQPRLQPQDDFKRVPTPRDAVVLAVADCAEVPVTHQHHIRYLWVPPWLDKDDVHHVNFGLNHLSRASTIVHPVVIHGALLRYDLTQFTPRIGDYSYLYREWEKLALIDPYFHVPAKEVDLKKAIVAPHLVEHGKEEAAPIVALMALTKSQAPILRADWFLSEAMKTPRYYDILGYERNPKNSTEERRWYVRYGAYYGTSIRSSGVQRSVLFHSGITGNIRAIEAFRGLAGGALGSLVTVSRDYRAGLKDGATVIVRNLLEFKHDASETIADKPNGLLDYAVFDGQGKLQNAVPPDIAVDHTIPAPVRGVSGREFQLRPPWSCLACHGTGNLNGHQDIGENHLNKIVKNGFTVLGDLNEKNQAETIEELLSLYGRDRQLKDAIRIGRVTYASAVAEATGGMDVAAATDGLISLVRGYENKLVTPKQAALELGIVLGDGASLMDVYPLKKNATDPVIAALLSGINVVRDDYTQVFGTMMHEVTNAKAR